VVTPTALAIGKEDTEEEITHPACTLQAKPAQYQPQKKLQNFQHIFPVEFYAQRLAPCSIALPRKDGGWKEEESGGSPIRTIIPDAVLSPPRRTSSRWVGGPALFCYFFFQSCEFREVRFCSSAKKNNPTFFPSPTKLFSGRLGESHHFFQSAL